MKKCSFYTRKTKAGINGGIVERVSGWTDGVYNYYKNGDMWFCIVPDIGISCAYANSRKEAAEIGHSANTVSYIAATMDRDSEKLREKFNSLIQEAENN